MSFIASPKQTSATPDMLPASLRANIRDARQAAQKGHLDVASGWQSLGIALDGFLDNVGPVNRRS